MQHRRDLERIAVFPAFILVNLVIECPAVINFDRVARDSIDVRASLLGVAHLGHPDHPENHRTGEMGMLEGNGRIRREMVDVQLVILVEVRNLPVLVERVEHLQNAENISARGHERIVRLETVRYPETASLWRPNLYDFSGEIS